MDVDETNLLIEMINNFFVSSAVDPVVLYSDDVFQETIRLLSAEWHAEMVGGDTLPSRVSVELANRPVVAFPPWGREQGWPAPREASAAHRSRTKHPLLLVVPGSVLTSHEGEQLRMDLAEQFRLLAIATCSGRFFADMQMMFDIALVLVGPITDEPAPLRMFQAPLDWHSAPQRSIDDFRQLLRRSGGRTEFGYVSREQPEPGTALDHRLLDPSKMRRRAELSDYGTAASLDHLFQIFTGDADHQRGPQDDPVEADIPGARRLISARDVLRTHVISPPEDQFFVNVQAAELQVGDIVIPARQFASDPGLVWARVSEADLPSVAGTSVVVLRPVPSTNSDQVEFVLRYLSTRHALELYEDPRLWVGPLTMTPIGLSSLRVPLPDEHLADALRSADSARRRAAEWAREADQILDALFENDSASMSRQNVIERTRMTRLRIQAVDDVETLSGRVRTQYPLPIAYCWRVFEALRSSGPTREAYLAALDCAEQTLAFTANVGLALAREAGTNVSTLEAIGAKLARRQGPSMADWSNVLDELAGRAFASIDDMVATTEFRDFCRDDAVAEARRELLNRRNDEAHQRRVESTLLGEACDMVVRRLEQLLRALEFWLDNPLVIAKSVHWDTIEQAGSLSYQRLAGDHPIVPTSEMRIHSPMIESDSLYLLDSNHNMHLLRPFLVGTNCAKCGYFSTFHVDRFLQGTLTMKSMEHGHTINASEALSRAVQAAGLLAERTS